jgi:hypothetical protein
MFGLAESATVSGEALDEAWALVDLAAWASVEALEYLKHSLSLWP